MRSPVAVEADLIAGLATPPGCAGVAVVRLSGPELPTRLLPLLRHPRGTPLGSDWFKPRYMHRLDLFDPEGEAVLDEVLAVYFPAPHSFTGEAQMEIHCHGAPVVVARLLALLTQLGVRMARPGEFSRRACQNGKWDVTRAEALMALIHSATLRAAREAARQLQGSLAETLGMVREGLLELLVQVEMGLDFADEEVELLERAVLQERLQAVGGALSRLTEGALLGRQWQDGLDLVIAGRPNVGKSSLFNRLAGRDKAIVTAVPGTTRDLNEHPLALAGVPVLLVDTAGLRQTAEPVEQEGIRRARERMRTADGVLLLYDARTGLTDDEQRWAEELGRERIILVANKLDLCAGIPVLPPSSSLVGFPWVGVSCMTGAGLEELVDIVQAHCIRQPAGEEGSIILVARQREALARTVEAVGEAQRLWEEEAPGEIVALALRAALEAVGELAGETRHEHLLDRIFSQFCLGK
ncbi:MAG: tRNA uridine-5-carboxymethylaminomethyl(34) synthesis GTPase MnmE [Magnetococcus sp. DMHC-8]